MISRSIAIDGDGKGCDIHGKFLRQGLMPEADSDIGYIGLGHCVACNTPESPVFPEPVLLALALEAALGHAVLCQLAHVNGAELVDLRSYRVLLYQGLLCECKLQRIVSRQTDIQPALEVRLEWIPFICQKEGVVAEWRHGNADLLEVENVLQEGNFAKKQPVADTVTAQDGRSKMIGITCFSAVRTQVERVETSLLAPDIQGCHVGKDMVDPVTIRRILFRVPGLWHGKLAEESPFWFAFIIDAVKANDAL